MKKKDLILFGAALIAVLVLSFMPTPQRLGSVKGSVKPADAATQAWLFGEKDTLRSAIKSGFFEFAGVKPGVFALVIDAVAPYKRTTRTGIEVFEGSETNVGEVLLEKEKKK